jgi:hypothetical protein
MKIRVIRPVGLCRLDIEIDDRSDKEGLAKALFFTEPDICGLCDSVAIRWTQHKAKAEKDHQTYTYITRVCTKCGAESAAGDYQTGGMFWKRWAPPSTTRRREPPQD